MGPGAHPSRRLRVGHQGADDAVVLAVDPGDASGLLQPQEGVVHVALRDHHGGVGHIHLEGGDPLLHHLPDLPGDALVPVVDGHVEAVVAGAAPLRLFTPAGEAGGQGLPLVRGGEVHDRRGAAPQGRPGAGGEVVGGDGAAYLQVEVRVPVDEPGEEELPGAVHHLGVPGGEMLAYGGDPPVLYQDVQNCRALRRNDGPSMQQNMH